MPLYIDVTTMFVSVEKWPLELWVSFFILIVGRWKVQWRSKSSFCTLNVSLNTHLAHILYAPQLPQTVPGLRLSWHLYRDCMGKVFSKPFALCGMMMQQFYHDAMFSAPSTWAKGHHKELLTVCIWNMFNSNTTVLLYCNWLFANPSSLELCLSPYQSNVANMKFTIIKMANVMFRFCVIKQ